MTSVIDGVSSVAMGILAIGVGGSVGAEAAILRQHCGAEPPRWLVMMRNVLLVGGAVSAAVIVLVVVLGS